MKPRVPQPQSLSYLVLGIALVAFAASARAQFVWTGTGTLAAALGSNTVASGVTLSITTTTDHDFNATAIVNNGTVNWTGGRLRSGNGGTVVNNSVWNDSASGTTSTAINNDYGGTTLTFTNAAAGTYTKTASGQTSISAAFINDGALILSAGSINLAGGGSFSATGTTTTATGATLYFSSNFTVADGSKLSGAGDYILSSGTLNLSGVVGVAGFKLQGGTLSNSQTFNSTVPWTGTSLNSSGTTTIGAAGTLTISGTNDHDFNTRSIVNNGTVNWTQGRLRSGNGGTIVNNAAWNDSASGTTSNAVNNDYGGTSLTFTNAATGTYTKTAAGQTVFNAPFINDGAVTLSAGSINLAGGGSFSGSATVDAAAGTFLYFNSNYSIANGASLLGAGSYQLVGSTLTISGTLTANNFTLAGGTLAGSPTFAGGVTWTAANLNTGGTTTNAAGSTFTITGANDHDFNTRSIVNSGTVNWTQGRLRSGNGGTIVNHGAWNDSASGTTSNAINSDWGGTPFVFTNSATGTYTKTATGQTNFNNGAAFVNAGTLALNAGSINLEGGGSFAGTGVANAAAGTTLYFNSNYTLANGAALNGPGTYWLYNGTLTMNGPLNVASFTQSNGTLTGPGTLNAGSLSLSGGTLGGSAVNITGSGSTWSAGNMNAAGTTAIGAAGVLGISTPADHDFSARSIVNNGTVNWTGGRLRSGSGGTIVNNAAWNDSSSGTTSNSINNDYGGTSSTFTNAANGTYTKSASGQTNFYIPFYNDGAVVLSAGSLNLQGGGSFSGTATASAAAGTTLYFNSNYSVANGASLLGAGSYYLFGSTLTLSGSIAANNFLLGGGTLAGTQSFNGGVTWTGTNLNTSGTTTNAAGSTFTVSGTNDHDFNTRALVNSGTFNWTQGRLRSGNGGTILNHGAWNDSASGTTSIAINSDYGGTALVFTNSATGTYTKTAAGQTNFNNGAAFVNAGTLAVNAGAVNLEGGGSFAATGVANVAAGATLYFNSNYTLADGAALNGPGTYWLYNGNLTINGPLNVGTFVQSNGALAGAGSLSTGTFNFTGGNNAPAAFTLTSGNSTWTSGAMNGAGTTTIGPGATLAISSGNSHDFNARTIVNQGIINWNLGYLRGGNGSTLTNAAGATFNDLNPSGYSIHTAYGGTTRFINNGTYRRNANATTSYLDVPFDNNGVVDVVAGDLQFRAGGSMSSGGSITVATGTNVFFTSGYSVANGASLTGDGAYWLTNGTFDVTGTMSVGTFNQTGGTLSGLNTLAGVINWTGGDWNTGLSGQSTTLASGTTLNLNGGNSKDFDRRAIINQGVVNWNLGYIRAGNGATFTNAAGATFNDLNPSGYTIHSAYGGSFTFVNNGTYNRNAAGTTSYLDIPFNNNGTVNVTAGDLQFRAGGTMTSGGSIAAAAGTNVFFTGGYAINNGSSLSGAGTYWLTAGTLTLTGSIGVGTFNQTGGSLAGNSTINGVFNWSGGDWNAGAAGFSTTIGAGATLNLNSGNSKDLDYRAVVNQGTTNWNLGYIRGGHGATFTNATGATFNDLNASGYTIHNPYGGSFAFVNNGTYTRNAANTTYFDTTFNHNGTLNLLQGDIQVRQGGTMGAASVVNGASGTNFYLTNNYTILDGAKFVGTGNFMQTGGTLTLDGNLKATAFNWSSGNWNASAAATTTIDPTTVLNLVSGNSKDFDFRSITNHGTVNWLLGYIRAGHGSVFTNATGATFNDQNASGYTVHNPFGGSFTFVNNGTYVRNVGSTTYFDTTFNNNGLVNLQQGDIRLRAGGTMSATSVVNAAAGTTLYFESDYTLASGAQLTGAGAFTQSSGTLAVTNLKASAFNWSGGTWNGAGTSTVDAGSVLNLVSGNNKDFDSRSIVNQGTINWLLGYIRAGNGSVLTNAAGATFNDQNASGYTVHNPFGGSFTFVNNGTYVRNVGSTTYFDTTFNNNGVINLQQGEMQIRQGGTMSATSVVNAAAGTAMYFTNNYTLAPGSRLLGAGTFAQTAGTLTVDTLKASSFTWTGGNWNGAGTSVIDAGTVLNLASGNNKDFDARTIINRGVVNWSSGYLRSGNGGSFTNATGGVFNDQNTSSYTVHNPFGGSFSFINDGTYSKATTGTTTFSVPFTNTGTLSVTAGAVVFGSTFTSTGSIALGGNATAQFSGPLNLGTSPLTGTGTIQASSVTAGGNVAPGNSPGRLSLTGNLTLLTTSTLLIELGGTAQGTGYDFLSVGGNATIAGNLQLSFVNGFQGSALPSDTFTILTASGASGLTGTFANVPTSGLRIFTTDGFGSFQVGFTSSSVVLSNFVAVPEPSTWTMLVTGTALMAWQIRRRRR